MSLHVSGYQGICTKISDTVNKTEHMFHALRRSHSNLPTYSHLQVLAINLIQVPGNRCAFNDQKPFFAPLNSPHIPAIPGLGWAGIYIDWCIINKTKSFISVNARRSLYCTLVLPYIQYCNIVWAKSYTTNLDFKNV